MKQVRSIYFRFSICSFALFLFVGCEVNEIRNSDSVSDADNSGTTEQVAASEYDREMANLNKLVRLEVEKRENWTNFDIYIDKGRGEGEYNVTVSGSPPVPGKGVFLTIVDNVVVKYQSGL